MNLKYSVYMIMLLIYSNEGLVYGDNTKVYNINDEVLSCSSWLSRIIYNFCNNTYKIVKRETTLMIEKIAPSDLQIDTNRRRLDEGRWRRVRRQVATECCLHPCKVGDIIMYCPHDAKLLLENPGVFD